MTQFFEEEDLHDGFAPGLVADPDVAGVSEDEVIEEQDQAQELQDLLLDNAGDPRHEIAGVPTEEANEIDIERPNIQHPQLEEQQTVETVDEEVEEF